jgi:hypothetical protein
VRGLGSWRERLRGGLNRAWGVLEEYEEDEEGIRLAAGTWDREGWVFWGLEASVVGVGEWCR